MDSFSRRMGVVPKPTMLQLDSVSDDLRTSLWNVIVETNKERTWDRQNIWVRLARSLAKDVFITPLDKVPIGETSAREWLGKRFSACAWNECYDAVECAYRTPPRWSRDPTNWQREFEELLNRTLERELSGFRLVDGILVRIVDPAEVEAVESALAVTADGFDKVHEHLKTALDRLADKPKPDCRNAMKEAISAVESVCQTVCGTKTAGLAGALAKIEAKHGLHRSFKKAFEALYGYTSDSGGVRHGLIDDTKVGFDEAKFMVVACASFVHYVIAKTR